MNAIRRPEFLSSWIGKTLMIILVAGMLAGIFLPVTPDQSLTYWTIFSIVAGVILLVFIIAGSVEKCWAYTATLCMVIALILMAFFKVILPNIR